MFDYEKWLREIDFSEKCKPDSQDRIMLLVYPDGSKKARKESVSDVAKNMSETHDSLIGYGLSETQAIQATQDIFRKYIVTDY